MTNAIPAIAQAAQTSADINWTLVISVCAVSVAAMTAAINIFKGRKAINDDELRESNLFKDVTENVKSNTKKSDDIKEVVNTLRTEVEKIKVEMLNTGKSIEELRKDNKDLVQRLDELLKSLMDLLGS